VTLGEIESIALRNNWGEKKLAAVQKFFTKCIIADINSKDVIRMYGEIDNFSQGKSKDKLLGSTSRNMGKNDIWIAATAAITKSVLLTSDKDFSHLNKSFFSVELIELIK
jgi:tRNA(fMet)-specific endonuclease VapC